MRVVHEYAKMNDMFRQFLNRLSEHPRERDTVIGVVWLLLGIAFVQFGMYGLWQSVALLEGPGWVFLLIAVALAAVSTQRSTRPLTALALGAAVVTVDLAFGGSLIAVIVATDLIYAAVKYASDIGLKRLLFVGLSIVALVSVALLIWRPQNAATLVLLLQWALIIGVSALWGWNVRHERLRTVAVLDRQFARDMQVLRGQIAHDLHDLVANQIAVAGLHIEASKLQAERLGITAEPLMTSLSRAKRGTDAASTELRQLISALSALEEITAAAAVPINQALHEFEELLPSGRELVWQPGSKAQLERFLETYATSHADMVVRALRELVANAVKHGAGDVQVRRLADQDPDEQQDAADGLVLCVENQVASARALPGNGMGLRGTQLLLNGLGGNVHAERSDDGSAWQARIELTPPAVHASEAQRVAQAAGASAGASAVDSTARLRRGTNE
ncbi:hypothetical protein FW756_07070 [Leucobacter sp. 1207-22]